MKTRVTETDFLTAFPYFRMMEAGDIVKNILSSGCYEAAPADTLLQMEGQHCRSMGFMLSGEKRVYKISEKGREITLYEVGPGEICILNASCILSDSVCPVNARSITDVEMLILPPGDFAGLIHQYRSLRNFVFSIISDSFGTMIELINEIVFSRLDERLIDYLIEKSEDNRLITTHQRIADDLGTAREVVSRLLKDMEKKGRIALTRNQIRLIRI